MPNLNTGQGSCDVLSETLNQCQVCLADVQAHHIDVSNSLNVLVWARNANVPLMYV